MELAEDIVKGALSNILSVGLLAVTTDALYARRILKTAAGFFPSLERAVLRHELLQRAAISGAECPLDFYALHFACLIPLSVALVIFAGDMSNVFFGGCYSLAWYVFLFALSVPVSYCTGVVCGAAIKVSFKRLNDQGLGEEHSNQRFDKQINRKGPVPQRQDDESEGK